MNFQLISSTLLVSQFLFEQYLNYRQAQKAREPFKTSFEIVTNQETFEKAQIYSLNKLKYSFISSLVYLLFNLLLIYKLNNVWLLANSNSIYFVWLYGSLSYLVGLPLSLYSTFVVEREFNQMTVALFCSDSIKTYLLSCAIGLPFTALFIYTVESTQSFYYYLFALFLIFQLFFITIFPVYIQPLFNKFSPLKEGSLKDKIYALANRIDFPLTKLFTVDGSKRSSHSNAYFFGFFKNKRIVLFDTLEKHCNEEEICAILAHELGHWKLNHVFKTFLVNQIHLFITFYMFAQVIDHQPLYNSFQFSSKPTIIGFILFNNLIVPLDSLLTFLMNVLSRLFEFQADAYAVELGYAVNLKSGLVKINKENLGNVNPDWLYSAYKYSHPPIVERLNAIPDRELEKKKDK